MVMSQNVCMSAGAASRMSAMTLSSLARSWDSSGAFTLARTGHKALIGI
jgi:hypothetical protein